VSTKDFGCFLCTGKSADRHGLCQGCGASIDVSAQLLKCAIGPYTPISILGRGFYGWTLLVREPYGGGDIGMQFAIKLLPKHRLKATPTNAEADTLISCSRHRNLASFIRIVEPDIQVGTASVPCIGLVFEYIANSFPLSQINASHLLTRKDVTDVVLGIAHGLARMHAAGFWHNDLHDDNLLLRPIESGENLPERFEPKLIDFGSATPISPGAPERQRSDYWYIAKHIHHLISAFEAAHVNRMLPTDRTFARRMKLLAHSLADVNVSRRDMTPQLVITRIQAVFRDLDADVAHPTFADMREARNTLSFSEPLDNSNALNLYPQDIVLLFTDNLGWSQHLTKSETVLIAGPRGCGKTMLLRHLSIAIQARPRPGEDVVLAVTERLSETPYFGVLVTCGEVRTPFLRSSFKRMQLADPDRAEDFAREYLNLQFYLELLRTVAWVHREKLLDISESDVHTLAAAFQGIADPARPVVHNSIEALIESADRRCVELSNLRDSTTFSPTDFCRDDVLPRLALAVRSQRWAQDKELWFLLDDYSPTVLPEFVHMSFNPAVFRLSPHLRVKMTSEGAGPTLCDRQGRKYKEGREITRVQLGEIYFAHAEEECLAFIRAILDARFKAMGHGDCSALMKLLGEHPSTRKFGEYILGVEKPGDARFHGFSLLASLCSGDVSSIIELFHQLYQQRGAAEPSMSAARQDAITKRFAQRQLADLRQIADVGPSLYTFAERVGGLLKGYLLRSKGKVHADERLRIEIEGDGELAEAAQKVHEELLRHSILVDGGAGKSRSGLPTRKLFFRRLFAPCFPFSPVRAGCIALTMQEYQQWLNNPDSIWREPPQEGGLFQ